ncbi:MAG TPA: plasmid replication protein, CyRepA1 family [Stenomitos sp.]
MTSTLYAAEAGRFITCAPAELCSIQPNHFHEWQNSAITPDLITLNVLSLEGEQPYEYLCTSTQLDRLNGGRLSSKWLRLYQHTTAGGWWCNGLDPLNQWQTMEWGCFKPNVPRLDTDKQKPIKYEHPPKTPTRAFFMRVSWSVGLAIATTHNLRDEYLARLHQLSRFPLLTSGDHPAEDEGFWQWVLERGLPITIVEGAKKAASLLSAGYVAIALPGIFNGYRSKDELGNPVKPQLIPELLPFATGRKVTICFDHDAKPKTAANVAKAIQRLGQLFEAYHCPVQVVDLPGPEKGVDDFIVARGAEAFGALYDQAHPLKHWKLAQRLKNNLTWAPSLRISQADLSTLEIAQLPDEGIVAIASPKGTGKTKFIAHQVADSERAILASHRVALARHLCHRLNMDYRGDIDKVKGGDFIAGSGYTFRVGTCVDSLLAIDPDKFAGCDLVIDEICQVLRHLLTSSTCNKEGKRPAILARFRALLQAARRVIVADADLDNQTLHYLKALRSEDSPIYLIRNDVKPDGYPIRFIEAPDRTKSCELLLHDINALSPGKVLYVTTDSKTTSKTLFQLITQLHSDKRVLLINSDTSGGEDERAFIANPDQVLANDEYDIILCSPSVATGTSIEVQDIIWKVYGIFMGVSGTDADIAQSLARVRQPVERIVWCAPTGRNFCKVSRSTNALELKGHLFERTSVSVGLMRSSLKADTLSTVELVDWASDPHIQLFAQISAAQNFAMHNLRDALYVRLVQEGNQVTLERSVSAPALKLMLQQSREATIMADAHAILNADDLSATEVFALEQKEAVSPEQQRAIAKYHLKEFYCLEELSLQDILLDREGRTRGELLNLEAQLYPGLALDRTVKALERQASWKQHLCPWDIPGTELRREIREKLGLTAFIRKAATGWEWTRDDLAEIAALARQFAPAVKAHLNFTCSEEISDVQIVHQLLSQLGLKTQFRWTVNNPDHAGTKIRVFSLNQGHWKTCWGILERRSERRERLKNIESPDTAGSPLEFSESKDMGDPTAKTEKIDHLEGQRGLNNRSESLPLDWNIAQTG